MIDPPESISLDGLPINVVPIGTTRSKIKVILPTDATLDLSREQADLSLNFAMTDYCSQGMSRKYNVADINGCSSYFGAYTALSRGQTAAGTLIVQDFNVNKITGGTMGDVRQEFRELELLNKITKLKFEHKLPGTLNADTRYTLITDFRKLKGAGYIPAGLHPSITWSLTDVDKEVFPMEVP